MTERLRRMYAEASDLEIRAALGKGSQSYSREAWEVLVEEGRRRQLIVESPATGEVSLKPHALELKAFEPEAGVVTTGQSAATKISDATQTARRSLRDAWITTGVGVVFTLGSFVMAPPGGVYMIFFGAIGVGLYRVFVSTKALEVAEANELGVSLSQEADVDTEETSAALRQLEAEYREALRRGAAPHLARRSFERQAAALKAARKPQ